jgi:hypothetical protein
MITIEELSNIQTLSTSRSKEPGIPVIARRKLATLIQSKVNFLFNVKHLNIAVELYCRRGHGIKMNLGKKKYNLIAEKVPSFIDWFFIELDKGLYPKIEEELKRHFDQGMKAIKMRRYSGRFLYVLENNEVIYKTSSLEKFSEMFPELSWQRLYKLFNGTKDEHKGFRAIAKIRIKLNGEAELTTPPNDLALEVMRSLQDGQMLQELH